MTEVNASELNENRGGGDDSNNKQQQDIMDIVLDEKDTMNEQGASELGKTKKRKKLRSSSKKEKIQRNAEKFASILRDSVQENLTPKRRHQCANMTRTPWSSEEGRYIVNELKHYSAHVKTPLFLICLDFEVQNMQQLEEGLAYVASIPKFIAERLTVVFFFQNSKKVEESDTISEVRMCDYNNNNNNNDEDKSGSDKNEENAQGIVILGAGMDKCKNGNENNIHKELVCVNLVQAIEQSISFSEETKGRVTPALRKFDFTKLGIATDFKLFIFSKCMVTYRTNLLGKLSSQYFFLNTLERILGLSRFLLQRNRDNIDWPHLKYFRPYEKIDGPAWALYAVLCKIVKVLMADRDFEIDVSWKDEKALVNIPHKRLWEALHEEWKVIPELAAKKKSLPRCKIDSVAQSLEYLPSNRLSMFISDCLLWAVAENAKHFTTSNSLDTDAISLFSNISLANKEQDERDGLMLTTTTTPTGFSNCDKETGETTATITTKTKEEEEEEEETIVTSITKHGVTYNDKRVHFSCLWCGKRDEESDVNVDASEVVKSSSSKRHKKE